MFPKNPRIRRKFYFYLAACGLFMIATITELTATFGFCSPGTRTTGQALSIGGNVVAVLGILFLIASGRPERWLRLVLPILLLLSYLISWLLEVTFTTSV